MTTAVLTQGGLLRLPQKILERLGLRRGDRVEIEVEGDAVRLLPAARRSDVEEYLGLCHGVYEGLTEQDIDEITSSGYRNSR